MTRCNLLGKIPRSRKIRREADHGRARARHAHDVRSRDAERIHHEADLRNDALRRLGEIVPRRAEAAQKLPRSGRPGDQRMRRPGARFAGAKAELGEDRRGSQPRRRD